MTKEELLEELQPGDLWKIRKFHTPNMPEGSWKIEWADDDPNKSDDYQIMRPGEHVMIVEVWLEENDWTNGRIPRISFLYEQKLIYGVWFNPESWIRRFEKVK